MNQCIRLFLLVFLMVVARVMPYAQSSSFLLLDRRCLRRASRYSLFKESQFSRPSASNSVTSSSSSSSSRYGKGSQNLEDIQESLVNKFGEESTLALSFFKFAPIEGPDMMAMQVRSMLEAMGVLGTVYIATEGINAAMCIPTRSLSCLKRGFEKIDERYFNDIRINVGECMSHNDTKLFKKLLVKSRKQILTDGLSDELDWNDSGEELPASKWHDELDKDEPLVIDCRNSYESDIGTFENAKPLETEVFSESWEKIDSMLENVPTGKKIMTFCTGGIRCVKINAYLKQKLGYNNIYRLSHGIIDYENWVNGSDDHAGETISSKFSGSNYLFDGRRKQTVQAQQTGNENETNETEPSNF